MLIAVWRYQNELCQSTFAGWQTDLLNFFRLFWVFDERCEFNWSFLYDFSPISSSILTSFFELFVDFYFIDFDFLWWVLWCFWNWEHEVLCIRTMAKKKKRQTRRCFKVEWKLTLSLCLSLKSSLKLKNLNSSVLNFRLILLNRNFVKPNFPKLMNLITICYTYLSLTANNFRKR